MIMPKAKTQTTDEFLAAEFASLRLQHFSKLAQRVKKLVLEIVQYYLGTFHCFDDEASAICIRIETLKNKADEPLMVQCYKDFLEFLPIKLRSGIQGKNLFRQPTSEDLVLAEFYVNDMKMITAANRELHGVSAAGLSQADLMKFAELHLSNNASEPVQPGL